MTPLFGPVFDTGTLKDTVQSIRQGQPGLLMPIQARARMYARIVQHHEIQHATGQRESIYTVEVRAPHGVHQREVEEKAAEEVMGQVPPYPKRTGHPVIDGIVTLRDMGDDLKAGLDPDVMRAYRDDLRFWDERFKEETGIDPVEDE